MGIGARMGFAWATSHGAAPAIGRFSVAHSITSVDAWVAALFLMALAEVVTRLAVLWLRSGRLPAAAAASPARAAVHAQPASAYSSQRMVIGKDRS